MKISAVVVTYCPDILVLTLQLKELVKQVDSIIIIDNGSINQETIERFEFINHEKVEYIPMSSNMGLAYCQNIGIIKAKSMESTHVLLLDQDSIPSPSMVDKLAFPFKFLPSLSKKIAATGPVRIDRVSGKKSYFMTQKLGVPRLVRDLQESKYLHAVYLISSGSLIPLDVLDDVGLMKSEFFIDRVDTDWSFRAKSLGYELIGVTSAILNHSLGDNCESRLTKWQRFNIPWHSPLRHYYVFRNTILMLKQVKIPFIWQLHAVWRLFQLGLFFLTFTPSRRERLKYVLLGLQHGFKSISGRLNQNNLMCELIPQQHDLVSDTDSIKSRLNVDSVE